MSDTAQVAIGVDLGGTKTAVAVVTSAGRVLARRQGPTPAVRGPEAVLRAVADLVRPLCDQYPCAAIGVGSAGTIDHRAGVVLSATDAMPGWGGTTIVERLEQLIGRAVVVDNDVNAHALGEAWCGVATGTADVLTVAVGTGVGGAIISGGRLVRGARGGAGEIGHLPVRGAARRCSCGALGHLEGVAAGPAISRAYAELGDGEAPGLPEIGDRALRGDVLAEQVIREAATALGQVMAGLVCALDPAVVVLTGGVTGLGRTWWDAVGEACRANLIPAVSPTPIVASSLGGDGAVLGAARLVWEAS